MHRAAALDRERRRMGEEGRRHAARVHLGPRAEEMMKVYEGALVGAEEQSINPSP